MLTMNELCDLILRVCFNKTQLHSPNYFSLQKLCTSNGASVLEADGALQFLSDKSYLVKQGDNYVITPFGEEFFKTGGFSGLREREAKEEQLKQEERERTRLVNQSVLDTNKSVRQTHSFQRWTTIATLVVAISAVVVALLGYFKGNENLPIQQILKQQKQIDSLEALLRKSPSADSLGNKGH
jgi:hypothetical protein